MKMTNCFDLSIIIPAYNEADRIGHSLEQICLYLDRQPWSVQVIVVNDGSSDDTIQVVEQSRHLLMTEQRRLELVSNSVNRGKGYCVKTGAMRAEGGIIVLTDADLSAPIDQLADLVIPIHQGQYDVVIGSRAIDRRLIQQRQPFWREYAGRLFNILMRLITGLPFKDTQCGFKAFRGDLIRPIFQRQRLDGFAFDVEVLYLAWKAGLRIKEIPVVWNHVEGSRVHIFRDSFKMLMDLVKVKIHDWHGDYHSPTT
ncbi:MAG: glycosyltransferase family 2 protein [Acidobacteriota bacterium]|nr:glycosyltransferase family 2 protein [Blastocatellia bacterium]MDW8238262.1 glycosyltransferase family 2 protein [Acidobacteriota bacterium]